ncbi:hypothetical protein FE257_001936 [Aspergillus nanangensis]|uniref:Uncharacterized protein n=1 Tax=Aspergillus nanangensis TaxID=2582783 RepID=A0AAD4GPB0_ASPNN|nr:hypothetical protein FE257_001936 [Aspergillus nanangensis]
MAGVKRKLDATRGSASGPSGAPTASTVPSTPSSAAADTSHIRVTRSHRASQDARTHHNDSNATPISNAKTGPPRLSRIITLKTRPIRPDAPPKNAANHAGGNSVNGSANPARETRASRTRAAAPLVPPAPFGTHQPNVESIVPETPRPKRVKRSSVAEETPRTTRQSARLRSYGSLTLNEDTLVDAPAIKKTEASPSVGVASGTRARNKSRHTLDGVNDPVNLGVTTSTLDISKFRSPDSIAPDSVEEVNPQDRRDSTELNQGTPHPMDESGKAESPEESKNETNGQAIGNVEEPYDNTKTPSPSLYRKRQSSETNENLSVRPTSASESPTKRLKLEEGELDHALERHVQKATDNKADTQTSMEDSKMENGSRQITEEIEGSTPEPTTIKLARGGRHRGRGRGGRSRAAARFAASRRGRGGTRSARGGRTGRQLDRSSDVEMDRSPSPSAATQKLRDRQRELDRTFKRIAAAQRLALAVLASQSQKKLARDKNAHRNVPEWEEINTLLKARLHERQDTYRREYEQKVAQEKRLFTGYKEVIESRYRASAKHIQEEHLLASQGEYMAFVEGRRAAEDDEHTETDGSETEGERGLIAPPTKQFVRGCNSTFVRQPSGAAAYDRGRSGWEDFVQRAKLGDDIDPQMKQMKEAGPLARLSAPEIINLLLEATGVVEVRYNGAGEPNSVPFPDVRPTALSALADAAAAEFPRPSITQTTPLLSARRTLLPQPHVAHGPTDPRSFVLPPPTPHRQPPTRRLLPAGQQIPPISEQLGLPDPFASMGGPPQLPPPPGSNFQRPPLPSFFTSHHPASRYFPPPPPPSHRPPY